MLWGCGRTQKIIILLVVHEIRLSGITKRPSVGHFPRQPYRLIFSFHFCYNRIIPFGKENCYVEEVSFSVSTLIERYLTHLREAERSSHTISKYAHDFTTFLNYLNGKPLSKANLIEWKSTLVASFMPTTVNSMLVGRKRLSIIHGLAKFESQPAQNPEIDLYG